MILKEDLLRDYINKVRSSVGDSGDGDLLPKAGPGPGRPKEAFQDLSDRYHQKVKVKS